MSDDDEDRSYFAIYNDGSNNFHLYFWQTAYAYSTIVIYHNNHQDFEVTEQDPSGTQVYHTHQRGTLPISAGALRLSDSVDMGSNKITNLADPTDAQDAATKNYTDTNFAPLTHGDNHSVTGSDPVDVRGLQGGWLTADTEANRPAAGTKDRYFYATDTGKLYYDDGTSWIEITPTPATHANEAHDPDMLPLSASSAIDAYMSGNKWLSVATSGIVGLPKQSVVWAYLSSDQTVADGTAIKVALDTVVYDVQSEFDTTQHRWTATEAGRYLIICTCLYSGDTVVADKLYQVAAYKNGAANVGWVNFHSSHTGGISSFCMGILNLSAGDYIEMYAKQWSGIDQTVVAGRNYTFMAIAKLT